jgi:hypothetical protein
MSNAVAKVHERGQEPVDEKPCGASHQRQPHAFRALEASLAWCRPCHNGPTSATSSAITAADRPVILRSLMLAVRVTFPTTRP